MEITTRTLSITRVWRYPLLDFFFQVMDMYEYSYIFRQCCIQRIAGFLQLFLLKIGNFSNKERYVQ